MKRFLTIAALCLFGSLPAKADIITIHANQSWSGYIDGPYDTSTQRLTDWRTGEDFGVIYLSPYILEGSHMPNPHMYDIFDGNGVSGYRFELTASGGGYSIPYRVTYGACNVGGTCGGTPTSSTMPQALSEESNYFSFHLLIMAFGEYQFNPFDITAAINLPEGYHVRGVAAVPEPATWLMMLLGFAALGGLLQLKNAKRTVEVDRESLACR
jgi:hypothetical protein